MSDHLDALISFGEAVDLAGLLERPAWQFDAACPRHPVDLFFPSRGQSNDEAKAICGRCSVTSQCLAHALDVDAGASGLGRRGVPAGRQTDEQRDRCSA